MDKKEIEKMLMTDIDNSREKAFEIAQFIFDHPEISRQEYESSEYLAHYLETEGFAVEMPYCGIPTAFKATRKNGSGPRIAFMAEYDALPGMGHACGHHWIASTSLMAGITLAKALDYLEGEVTVFGTPGEETGEGKPYMVDQGAFDGYQAALEIHPQGCTSLELDMIAIGGIDITFTGTASHAGAAPYNGVNALDAVITFFNSVNAMRQQLRDGTRVHGIITEGGTAVNIIPETGKIRIEVRAKEMDYWNEVLERVVKCAEGAALATGCELEWHHFEPTCAGLLINKNLEKLFVENMKDFPEFVESGDRFAGGASDVGNVSQVIPTFHPMMKFVENGASVHTVEFRDASLSDYAKERAIDCIKILTKTGLQLLEDRELAYSL